MNPLIVILASLLAAVPQPILSGTTETELGVHKKGNVYAPEVQQLGDRWWMWYGGQGRDGHDRIHLATSTDLKAWDKQGVVLEEPRVNHQNDPSVVRVGDVWWMSQFLDCFSPRQVVDILRRVRAAMPPDATLYILESFWDRQRFEAAAYSLNATSLYFTCLANGNSRFYRCGDFLELVREAGLTLIEQVDGIGLGHSLLRLRAG